MSKRGAGANWGGDEERYGGAPSSNMDNADKPVQATAAQMARRKIMAPKKSGTSRARSGSPAVTQQNGSLFGAQPQQQQPVTNSFNTSSFDYSFGQTQPQQQNGSASASAFTFATSASAQPQQNGITNPFAQFSTARLGSTPSTQPQQNGFNPSTSMFNTQPAPQSSSNNVFSGFGQSQPMQQNGTSAIATPFGGTVGSQPQNGTQQNGTANLFGGFNLSKPAETTEKSSTSIFSDGFGQQTQQNGNKAASPFPSFGQQRTQGEREKSAAPFSGFGQQNTQAEREKSATPFSGFGQQNTQQDQTSKASTPFSAFGQQNTQDQQPSASTAFTGFGQQRPQEEREKSSTPFSGFAKSKEQASSDKNTGLFAGLGAKAPESSDKQTNGISFGQQSAGSTESASTLFGKKPAETTSATTATSSSTNLFAGLGQSKPAENASKSLFAPPQAEKATPKLGGSMFGQSSASVVPGSGLFGSKSTADGPAKGTGSIFDQIPQKDVSASKFTFDSSDPSQVYKAGDDDDDEEDNAHRGADQISEASTSQTPKSNPFGTFGQSQSTQQTPNPTSNLFAQAQGSTSLFKPSTSGKSQTSMDTSSATPHKSLFQSSKAAETPAATTTPAAQPPRSLFSRIDQEDVNRRLGGQSDETPKASLFSTTPAPQTSTKSTFTPSTTSLFQKPQAPTSDEQTPKASASTNLFSQSIAAAPPASPAPTFRAPPATAPVARVAAAPSAALTSQVRNSAVSTNLSAAQQQSMKELNEGLLQHLKTQDPTKDWSAIYRYVLVAAAEIVGRSAPTEDETHPAPPPITQDASNMTALLLNASTPATSLSSNPPATVPTNKKRHFEDDAEDTARGPATEKRVKPNEPAQYPKLPETASNTAKLFASTLDKSVSADTHKPAATPGFNPSTKSLFAASTSSTAATPSTGGFKPSFGATNNASTTSAATGGLRPSFSSTDNALATPASTGGFKPTGAPAGTSNFLSAFGNMAKKTEEAERRKRKAEDYDSDKETEEQWEKRDRAEQEAKRAKLAEAAKATSGFTIKPPTAATAQKAQGTGDKTWTPETPIKFNFAAAGNGAAATTTPAGAPPKFSLFAAPNDTTKPTPSSGLKFSTTPGNAATSDASTPAAAADGSNAIGDDAGADGEPSDEQHDAPSDDMNGLQAAERDGNEILAELPSVKTQINEHDESKGNKVWKPKTEGNIFLLKDKATGKTRMLCRAGAGRIVLNHNPNKGATFTQHSKKPTMVVASLLYDHIHTSPPGLAQWIFTFGSSDDAATFVRIMQEGTPK